MGSHHKSLLVMGLRIPGPPESDRPPILRHRVRATTWRLGGSVAPDRPMVLP